MSSFSWGDFQALAQDLWQSSAQASGAVSPGLQRSEALRRTIISRAYYAAFHRARIEVRKRGTMDSGPGNQHDKTWKALCTSGDNREILLGNKGADLCRLRNRADYDLGGITDADVTKALQICRAVREGLSG